MQTSFPVHSKVTSTPSSSSSASRGEDELDRASISAASDLAKSSELWNGSVLAGVIIPSSGVDAPELRLLHNDELLDEL